MTLIEKHMKSKGITLLVYQERKKNFFNTNVNTNILTESRTFWKTVKPFLTDKTSKISRITLLEEKKVISQSHLIVKAFNDYFISIPSKNMLKIKNMKALIHQKKTLFQVSLKNITTTQVLSWLKLKTNPKKLLDLGKLILIR